MALKQLHKIYINYNLDVKVLIKDGYEWAQTTAKEQSAAGSIGLTDAGIARQKAFVARSNYSLDALKDVPIPDFPTRHPIEFNVDLSAELEFFIIEGNIAINQDTEYLATMWMSYCKELGDSNSRKVAGSLIAPDYVRAKAIVAAIDKYIEQVIKRPKVDVPETGKDTTVGHVAEGDSSSKS